MEYRKEITSGTRKFQFGNNHTAITIHEIENDTVRYFDGHKDPIQARLFTSTIDEFANYLADNNARIHWTIGA